MERRHAPAEGVHNLGMSLGSNLPILETTQHGNPQLEMTYRPATYPEGPAVWYDTR
jgi:hypothetical protein